MNGLGPIQRAQKRLTRITESPLDTHDTKTEARRHRRDTEGR
jgi:hypothetical protein